MITIVEATLSDAPEIWRIQQAAFEGQAKIYNNYKLPPLVQTLESLFMPDQKHRMALDCFI